MTDIGLATSGSSVLADAAPEEWTRDRRFFTGMAVASALTVFVGFAPTYYLRGSFGGHPLTTLVHIHGALATSWILLFLTQASLVAARAQSWRGKLREPALRNRILTDGHSPSEYRASTVRNVDPWYAAFDVKPGETLYLAPAERVRVW